MLVLMQTWAPQSRIFEEEEGSHRPPLGICSSLLPPRYSTVMGRRVGFQVAAADRALPLRQKGAVRPQPQQTDASRVEQEGTGRPPSLSPHRLKGGRTTRAWRELRAR